MKKILKMSKHKEVKTLSEIFMHEDLLEVCNEEQKKQFEKDLIDTWNRDLDVSALFSAPQKILDEFKNPRSRKKE